MPKAIGILELISIARGIYVADQMVKAADVEIFTASSTCPGKYMIIVYGDVAAVEDSVSTGKELAKEFLGDSCVIPHVDSDVFLAMTASKMPDHIEAVGILELFSLPTIIKAADSILKVADLEALELRLGNGIGGKSYFIFTGDVDAVKIGIETGKNISKEKGLLVNAEVIPSPSDRLMKFLF